MLRCEKVILMKNVVILNVKFEICFVHIEEAFYFRRLWWNFEGKYSGHFFLFPLYFGMGYIHRLFISNNSNL